MHRLNFRSPAAAVGLCLATALACSAPPDVLAAGGLFDGTTDIGGPKRPGASSVDAVRSSYAVSGGGRNMWFTNDAFHFVWTKMSGDVSLTADITFAGKGGDPHRKACLIVRQGLEPDSAYADAALHGDGLTSLQYRESRGAPTREIQSNVKGPTRLRLEKRGKYVSMSVAVADEPLRPAGGAFRLVLDEPFHIGLGVCAHNDDNLETAIFSNVELKPLTPAPATGRGPIISTLETVAIASKDRRVTWWTTNRIEAPNWSRDGAHLYFNSGGRIHRIPPAGGEPELINTGFAIRNNNDHGISPDGTQLVISDQSQPDRKSRIYTLPIGGGTPKPVMETAPSYWHGWSPDGRTLAYCAERNGEFDVYTVPADGGPETRLTTAKGLDDGPDYSPDGKWIYFNSDRGGRMQIWSMLADGTQLRQLTSSGINEKPVWSK